MPSPDLAAVIRAALADPQPKRLSDALHRWEEIELSCDDAEGLCTVLAEQTDIHPLIDLAPGGEYGTRLADLAILFQQESTDAATRVLRDRGLPELARLFDAALRTLACPPHPITIIGKIFALYAYPPGVGRVAKATRQFPEEFLWQMVYGLYADERHPYGPDLVERLRNPLPPGFAGVVLLDLANTLSRENRLPTHPFDNPSGRERLEGFLVESDPRHFSYAHSAAAALPFINGEARNALAALAMDHPDTGVQMEAAWASAHRGGTAGLTFLARMCEDPRHSAAARGYLEELGKTDRVPAVAQEPDFQAAAEFCQWLAHPQEFGVPPTEIALVDTRELDWPPTNDRRQVWLFRFTFSGLKEDGTDESGIGMVGSVTFSLFGETTPEMSPEDVYGLHCCWELEMNRDPRAPEERSAQAGRKLLGI